MRSCTLSLIERGRLPDGAVTGEYPATPVQSILYVPATVLNILGFAVKGSGKAVRRATSLCTLDVTKRDTCGVSSR